MLVAPRWPLRPGCPPFPPHRPGFPCPRLLASTLPSHAARPSCGCAAVYGVNVVRRLQRAVNVDSVPARRARRIALSTGTIGLFGLIGAAGALAANAAGRLADAGHERFTTGATTAVPCCGHHGWQVALGRHSLLALIIGVIVLDLAVQGMHISNQSQIYRLRPEARARITSAYMTAYFTGGAAGSALSDSHPPCTQGGRPCALVGPLGSVRWRSPCGVVGLVRSWEALQP